MNLTTVDRERITDSMLKIQSARAALHEVDEEKIPHRDEIDCCLENTDHNLKIALGYEQSKGSEHDERADDPTTGHLDREWKQ
jgi:hypothetical protein